MSTSSISIAPGSVFVVSEWKPPEIEGDPEIADDSVAPSVIRGVCSSLEEVGAVLERIGLYYPDDSDLALERSCADEMNNVDPDLFATFDVVIVREEDDRDETDFSVWVDTIAKAAYAPLKLYWCTTDEGEEDWFMIAHTAREAESQHATAEGFNLEDTSANFIVTLPAELQGKGDEIIGWPTNEMLVTCGAKFSRVESPRVLDLAGQTFSEGMMGHRINQLHAGKRPVEN